MCHIHGRIITVHVGMAQSWPYLFLPWVVCCSIQLCHLFKVFTTWLWLCSVTGSMLFGFQWSQLGGKQSFHLFAGSINISKRKGEKIVFWAKFDCSHVQYIFKQQIEMASQILNFHFTQNWKNKNFFLFLHLVIFLWAWSAYLSIPHQIYFK